MTRIPQLVLAAALVAGCYQKATAHRTYGAAHRRPR
jgi:hypothetical protein